MTWLLSLLIGLGTAVLGLFGAGFVASLCVRWYRISSFEGGSGYYIVFLALLGGVVGLIVGIIASRYVEVPEGPVFLKGLGVALGSMTSLLAVVTVLAWLFADIPPKIDGRPLELAIEVRAPEGFTWPSSTEENRGVYATLVRPHRSAHGLLQVEQAQLIDGRLHVTATVPVDSSRSNNQLSIALDKERTVFFLLPLRGRPSRMDTEWSGWINATSRANELEPVPEKQFQVRYRVQIIPVPDPGPSFEQVEAERAAAAQAAFQSIAPDAPLLDWMNYTRHETPEAWKKIAVAAIAARPHLTAELTEMMQSSDAEMAGRALRLIEDLPQPQPELIAPVSETGRAIAGLIRNFNATSVQQDPSYLGAAEVSLRFSSWMVAVRTLREKSGADFTPELREILELARVRHDSHAMRQDVLRVASYYMQEWAGLEPLATDPKPR